MSPDMSAVLQHARQTLHWVKGCMHNTRVCTYIPAAMPFTSIPSTVHSRSPSTIFPLRSAGPPGASPLTTSPSPSGPAPDSPASKIIPIPTALAASATTTAPQRGRIDQRDKPLARNKETLNTVGGAKVVESLAGVEGLSVESSPNVVDLLARRLPHVEAVAAQPKPTHGDGVEMCGAAAVLDQRPG